MAKLSVLSLLLHSLLAVAAPQAKSIKDMTFDELVKPEKPSVIVNAQPVIRQGATRKLFRFGPYDLPGSNVRCT
jgi:hypothetical protein